MQNACHSEIQISLTVENSNNLSTNESLMLYLLFPRKD